MGHDAHVCHVGIVILTTKSPVLGDGSNGDTIDSLVTGSSCHSSPWLQRAVKTGSSEVARHDGRACGRSKSTRPHSRGKRHAALWIKKGRVGCLLQTSRLELVSRCNRQGHTSWPVPLGNMSWRAIGEDLFFQLWVNKLRSLGHVTARPGGTHQKWTVSELKIQDERYTPSPGKVNRHNSR